MCKLSMDGIDFVMDDEDGDKVEKDVDRFCDKVGGELICYNYYVDCGDEVMVSCVSYVMCGLEWVFVFLWWVVVW